MVRLALAKAVEVTDACKTQIDGYTVQNRSSLIIFVNNFCLIGNFHIYL